MLSNIARTGVHRPVTSCRGPITVTSTRYRCLVVRRNKIGDELLDFVTAGPKLRKWYGAGDRPTDGGEEQEPEEPDTASDVVLVTDADTPIGEQVVLQLILARQQLRLLVRDVSAAKTSYGPYATPLPADAVGPRALRGVKCLVVLGRSARGLLEGAKAAKVKHVVLLAAAPSAGGSTGGFSLGGFSLGGGSAAKELRELPDGGMEAAVKACGLPYSVVQVYGLMDPGRNGGVGVAVEQQRGAGGAAGGQRGVSREGLGALIGGLVDAVPERGRTLQAQAPGGSGSGSPSSKQQQEIIAAALAGLAEDA